MVSCRYTRISAFCSVFCICRGISARRILPASFMASSFMWGSGLSRYSLMAFSYLGMMVCMKKLKSSFCLMSYMARLLRSRVWAIWVQVSPAILCSTMWGILGSMFAISAGSVRFS